MTIITSLPYDFVGGTRAIADQVDANFNALVQALNNNVRNTLQAPTTFYVSSNGADLPNNGLTPTSPLATIGYTLALLRNTYDMNTHPVVIQLANGTYNEETDNAGVMPGLTGAGALIIQGNMSNPAMVMWNGGANACLNCANGALITVQGVTMASANANCIISQVHSRVFFNNIIFGACGGGGSHLVAARGATLNANGNYTISGGAARHAIALEAGEIYLDTEPSNYISFVGGTPTITLTGTPAFAHSFVQASSLGMIKVTATFSGTATGVRYDVDINGVINTGNQGSTYLPGSVAGTFDTGGQYV